jgi:hypothetical protein
VTLAGSSDATAEDLLGDVRELRDGLTVRD